MIFQHSMLVACLLLCSKSYCQDSADSEYKPRLRLLALHEGEIAQPQTSGILEFEGEDGSWLRFCDLEFGPPESYVACGQLGFSDTILLSESQRRPYRFDDTIRIKNVNCTGTESWITACRYENTSANTASEDYCSSGHPAIVTCLPPQALDSGGFIRLRGGALDGEGRVQLARNGRWGSVCGSQWNYQSANVACRQLGFGTAKAYYTQPQFGRGHGAIWIGNITCDGDEQSLIDCNYMDIPDLDNYNNFMAFGCTQSILAAVSCYIPDRGHQSSMDVIDGESINDGRVVVRINDRWGSICSDDWTIREAAVVCRQMGLGYAYEALQDVWYFARSGRDLLTVMVNVRCTGTENALSECEFQESDRNYFINCGNGLRFSSNYVGVVCTQILPDLQLDDQLLQHSISLDTQRLSDLECAASENCLAPSAYGNVGQNSTRQLLRFSVNSRNGGTADFRPFLPSEDYEWHSCHGHYHSMEEFSHYDILSTDTLQPVAEGHKASFCLFDYLCESGHRPRYRCSEQPTLEEQGISVGCSDVYLANFDCQWIDITDVEPGNYFIRVRLNPQELVAELDFYNNEVICDVTYDGSSVTTGRCFISDDYIG